MRRLPLTMAMAVAGAALAGCGSMTTTDRTTELTLAAAQDERRALLDDYESWAGDSADREAAEIVVAHALNGEFSDCMRSRGFPQVDWTNNVNPYPTDQAVTLPWILSPLDSDDVTQPALSQAWTEEWERRQNNPYDEFPGWGKEANDASLACLEAAVAADDEELDAIQAPDVVTGLSREWSDEVLGAPAAVVTAAEIRDYSSCLSAQTGLPARQGIAAAPEELADLVDAASPSFGDARDGEPVLRAETRGSQSWTEFEQASEEFAAAHRSCQGPVLKKKMAALGATARQFTARHSGAIARAQEHWRQVRIRADELTRPSR